MRLYSYTLDGGGEMGDDEEDGPDRTVNVFPMPKMALKQFYATLCSVGVEVVQ